jgi:hypothetical protein
MTHPLPAHDRLGEALAAGAPDAPPQMMASVMATLRAERLRGVAPLPPPWRRLGRRWRRLILALALLLPMGGAVGVAQASAAALPGAPLYSVRVLREHVTLALAATDTVRGSLALGYAQDRLVAMHHIVVGHGDLRVASLLRGDAVAYNRQAALARIPWLGPALSVQVTAAADDCARLWRDPGWQRVAGVATGRRAMDARLDALRRVADGNTPTGVRRGRGAPHDSAVQRGGR